MCQYPSLLCVFMMGAGPRLREESRTSQFKAFCCGLIAVGQTSIHRWGGEAAAEPFQNMLKYSRLSLPNNL